MRILVGHSRYQSGPVSGENRVVDDEVELLRGAGHDVLLWDPEAATASGFGLAKTAQQAIWATESVGDLRRAIRDHRPDVAHFHNLFPVLSPAVLRAASDDGIPTVMTLHNYRLLCLPATFLRDGNVCEDCLGHLPWRGIVHRCFRDSLPGSAAYAASLSLHRGLRSFERVALFLCVSRFVADKHVEAGWGRDRLEVKPNFTWPSPKRVGPGEYFLFLGRLSSEKGAGVLIETWRPELGRLVVAGDGPEMDLLRSK
ncbi:MAG: glycosyltransferase, partial [Actinobacteria bacterium]|nr:glycosyltransferase [Actinomycetota bacterium]